MGLEQLDANQPPERFYRGGVRIDRFRGTAKGPDFRPEDWVGSTTTLAGETRLGLSRLRDGRLVADAIAADPVTWLGDAHVARYGPSTMLLVKLLDAGQRLPVHAHPDDAFSSAHLHRPFGKAEAWYILDGGTIHLGLRHDVDPHTLAELVSWQDTTALLGLLHEREVEAGDVVYVPPGELHAVGKGVFLLELQQPEDLSILLEWHGFAIDGSLDGHLGLGFDLALQAVTTQGRSPDDIDRWVRPPSEGQSVLPADSEPFFRLERHVVDRKVVIEPGFAIVVVEDGELKLKSAGGSAHVARGGTLAIPHAAGALTISGSGTVLVCRPPRA
ncbi:mannose-6-phosphate isomerase [Microbacterium sp. cf046]|uniref:class I mannose-6-phosphate isomerase n=1 Tax=Microbacterium sp. cf046 TaxID=1761803 RepID=UPI0008EC3922|nr:class I mannose-6-phosphate isomerase [Microbacterium sp. cf046]SFS13604.1 mannose-6-phosphate isomerase [Microbacterium sp. cf046]